MLTTGLDLLALQLESGLGHVDGEGGSLSHAGSHATKDKVLEVLQAVGHVDTQG